MFQLDAIPLGSIGRIMMIILGKLRLAIGPARAAIGLPGRKVSTNVFGHVGVDADAAMVFYRDAGVRTKTAAETEEGREVTAIPVARDGVRGTMRA